MYDFRVFVLDVLWRWDRVLGRYFVAGRVRFFLVESLLRDFRLFLRSCDK